MDAFVAPIVSQAAYALVAFITGYLWNKSRSLAKHQSANDSGMRALLKAELKRIHTRAMCNGYITYEDGELAEEVYSAYHMLGGNGQGTAMIKQIRETRVVYLEKKA